MKSEKKFYVLTCIPTQFLASEFDTTKLMVHSTVKVSKYEAQKAVKSVAEASNMTELDFHAIAFHGLEADMLEFIFNLKNDWEYLLGIRGYLTAWDSLKSMRLRLLKDAISMCSFKDAL